MGRGGRVDNYISKKNNGWTVMGGDNRQTAKWTGRKGQVGEE